MKLTDLHPEWLKASDSGAFRHVETRAEADGVIFLCPACAAARGETAGVHAIICWFRGVPQHTSRTGPGRWDAAGDTFETLTLSPSVHLIGPGCGWHGWVQNGEAR